MAATSTSADPTPSGAAHTGSALVTGGAGFIGSHLVDHLLALGWRITVIDNLSTGRRTNLPASHPRLTFIQGSVSECLPALARAGEPRFDALYHLAAAVGVRLVIDEPVRSIETNVDETAAVLRFALAHGKPATLIASSSEVYGKSEKSPFSEDDDVVYGPTTRSRWLYAASKAIDEYLALAYHQKHALPVVITRFFNTVGPRQIGAYGMVLPNFVAAAIAGEDLPIHGDGRQSRCFCDVRDVVEALPRLLASPACRGRVFNVGSDRSISVEGLADEVIRTLSSRSGKRFIPYDRAYAAGFEDLRRREPDLRRIRDAIGFAPRIPLERTILDLAASMPVVPHREGAAT